MKSLDDSIKAMEADFRRAGQADSSYIDRQLKALLVTIIATLGTDDDPLLQAQSLGSYVFGAADIMTIATATIGLDPGLGFMTGSESLLLMFLGAMLQLVLPMTPYLLWTSGLIGWMTLVLESLVGASLWAVAHIHPDGEGIAGRAGQGYGLIVQLALQPILMILGLAFALFLMHPIGSLINATFIPAFSIALSSSDVGVVLFIAVIALYCALMLTAVKKTFDLIWFVPDNVLRWFAGLGSINLGRTGADIAAEAISSGNAGVRNAVPGATTGVAKTPGAVRDASKAGVSGAKRVVERFKLKNDGDEAKADESPAPAKQDVEKRDQSERTIRNAEKKN